MSLIGKAMSLITGETAADDRPLRSLTERELIQLESDIGRFIFGPVPKGHRREFFCLDEHTWIWYEEWHDEYNKIQSRTTRYELHNNGILKIRDAGQYEYLDQEEFQNFGVAIKLYYEQVMRGIYKRDPYTGQSLDNARSSAPATI